MRSVRRRRSLAASLRRNVEISAVSSLRCPTFSRQSEQHLPSITYPSSRPHKLHSDTLASTRVGEAEIQEILQRHGLEFLDRDFGNDLRIPEVLAWSVHPPCKLK